MSNKAKAAVNQSLKDMEDRLNGLIASVRKMKYYEETEADLTWARNFVERARAGLRRRPVERPE